MKFQKYHPDMTRVYFPKEQEAFNYWSDGTLYSDHFENEFINWR